MVYLITYDLNKDGQNYNRLYEEIKNIGSWWHYLDSTWLVDTTLDSETINKRLLKVLDKNDYLLIIRVARDYQGWLPKDAWDWMNAHIK